MKKRLVIIPAYNESGSIEKTVMDIKEHAQSFDYVIVNDCSNDDTLKSVEITGFTSLICR